MAKLTKAYLIDPDKQEITEIPYSGDITDIFRHIQTDALDAMVFNSAEDMCLVDNAGPANIRNSFFRIMDGPAMAGKGIVIGQGEYEELQDPYISIDALRDIVHFMGKPFARVIVGK